MKKCVLVNCFASSNEMRVEPIRDALNEMGYKTIYISSDYHHTLKKYVELDNSITPIHVKPYKKNLSINRLLSHWDFSKQIYHFFCQEQPDLIYVKFPPNTLVYAAYRYKRRFDCKIILDLFDLWPESLPISHKIKTLFFPLLYIWARYRDKYISCADLVLTECEMYKKVLGKKLPEETRTLYLTKEDIDYKFTSCKNGKIRLCFLGGVNNLINIDLIGKVINSFTKQGYSVSLDIIGDGSKRTELIQIAESEGCKVSFHGVIYDEVKKNEILSQCDLGLNLVRNCVKIALSIKSIEYFRAGLGVINNVPFDTENIIDDNFAGINVSKGLDFDIKHIEIMKRNARYVYDNLFSIETCKNNIKNIFRSVGV